MLGYGLLAACATLAAPPKTTPDIPERWSSTLSGATVNVESQWWRRFGDPVLSSLVETALQHSPDVQSAQAAVEQARAQRSSARSAWFPSLDAETAAQRSEGSAGSAQEYSAGLDASWEVDLFGHTRTAVAAADEEVAARTSDLEAVRLSLAGEVALAYVEVRSYQSRLEIARTSLAAQEESLTLTGWRVDAGLASSLDREQARTNRDQTRAQLAGLEDSLGVAEHRLAVLGGEPPTAQHDRLSEAGAVPAVVMGTFTEVPADTLRKRPDVRAAESRLRAESARVDAERADRWPKLTIGGSIGLAAATIGGLSAGGASVSALLANLSLPLFDGGRRNAEIAAQLSVREQTLARYHSAILEALEDVANALTGLATSHQRVEALTSARQSADNALTLAQQQYTAGAIDFLALLDAQRTALSVADDLAVAAADRTSHQIRLYKALGGGWIPEMNVTTSDSP